MAAAAAQYATTLRRALLDDLFAGQEEDIQLDSPSVGVTAVEGITIEGDDELSLQGVDVDLAALEEHDVIRGILEQGRVLREFTRDVDDKLRQAELEAIQEYVAESDRMVELHEQLQSCDTVLAGMEQLLGKFQSELGKVSEEIRQLQVQSQMMGTKLKNRSSAETWLGTFVDNLTVSERMVTSILDGEVDDSYLEHLLSLDKKLRFIGGDEAARGSQARRDVEPALEKLRLKALGKVRDHVLQKVFMLRRPKTNVQIIQQNTLLKDKYFVRFLRQHGQEIYQEVRNEYVATVSRIFVSQFRTYISALEKLTAAVAAANDLLGAPEGPVTSVGGAMLSLFKKELNIPLNIGGPQRATTEAVFELGERGTAVLGKLDAPAIIPHMAEQEGRKFPYEAVYRSVHKLLLDSAASEYFFCLDFFEDELVFRDVMAPVVAVVEGQLAEVVQDTYDIVGLMLLIRINGEHQCALARTPMPVITDYLDRVHLMLWPRLKVLLDMQLASIRQGAERELFKETLTPHYVTRRYAALAASLLALSVPAEGAGGSSGGAGGQEDQSRQLQAQTLNDMMSRLWAAMFEFLLRMSNLFRDKKAGIIFLISNHFHTHAVLRAAVPEGAPGGAAAARSALSIIDECEAQLANSTTLYAEDTLSTHFPLLVDWVRKAEQQHNRLAVQDGQQITGYGPSQASPILRDFGTRWQDALRAMHAEAGQQFTRENAACGREVVQASMSLLLKYYSRLLELVKRQGPEGQAVVADAVNVASIMYEVKRLAEQQPRR